MPEGDRTFFRCESFSSDCHARAQALAQRVNEAGRLAREAGRAYTIADVHTVWDEGQSRALGFDVVVREIGQPETIIGPPGDAGALARGATTEAIAESIRPAVARGSEVTGLRVPASSGSFAVLLAENSGRDLSAFTISSRDLAALQWSGGWLGVGGIGGSIVAGPNTFAGSYSCGCGASGAMTGTGNGLGIDLSSSPPAWLIWLAVGLGLYAATRK